MSGAQRRLDQVKDILTFNKTASTIPFDPESTKFPNRKDVPHRPGAPPGAAWVWGDDDNLGRINLLTPTRVKAASSEIRTGEMIPLNLPLNVPHACGFNRETFMHEIKPLVEGIAYDDLYTLNTQSSTQWDGFRHVAHMATQTFYNDTHKHDFFEPKANLKCSIHHLSDHGIAGRGVLLDYKAYADKMEIHYNPFMDHGITYEELYRCGRDQGIDIRPQSQGGDIKIGDLLFVRSGFIEAYHKTDSADFEKIALRPHVFGPNDGQRWAGLAQEEKMVDWLHDCYFAGAAGDSMTFEAWPSKKDYYLHEYMLAFWGCPIGELWNLEKLSQRCRETNRWTFFVTSSPANVPGGVGSHANAIAIL